MKKIHIRIADLRKEKNITQQQLADYMGVSFKTISKWETQSSMPDITALPMLAEYFQVTVDQLLGLVPLENEKYIAEQTGTENFWNRKMQYLLQTRKSYWNDDYIAFLIKNVWKIEKPIAILDCGCGYGYLGLLMLPHLPKGSTYTGIDFAETLIDKGRQLFEQAGLEATFIKENVHNYEVKNQYDMVISQAVLRHLDKPEDFMKKMIDFAKPGAFCVCIESNRELECAGLYVDGMDYQYLCKHDGLQKKWKTELEKQGRDYAIAIRVAHIMQKLGLEQVDVRMNDKVEFITTENPHYTQIKQDFLDYNDWTAGLSVKEREKVVEHFVSHGVNRKEAEEYCNQNVVIADYFSKHPEVGYTFAKGQMISYGKKKMYTD